MADAAPCLEVYWRQPTLNLVKEDALIIQGLIFHTRDGWGLILVKYSSVRFAKEVERNTLIE